MSDVSGCRNETEKTRDGLPVPGNWREGWREMSSMTFENDVADNRIRLSWDLEDQETNDEIVYDIEVIQNVSVLDEAPDGNPENLMEVLEAFMREHDAEEADHVEQ